MKKITTFILLMSCYLLSSQANYLNRINIIKNDSTLQVNNGDSTYIFTAKILTHVINGINSFSLTSKTYNRQNSTWITDKDTSYIWSSITSTSNTNQNYSTSKANDNLTEISLGRQYPGTRRKFIFTVSGTNGTLTKEFDF